MNTQKRILFWLFLLSFVLAGCCEPQERFIIHTEYVTVTATPGVGGTVTPASREATPDATSNVAPGTITPSAAVSTETPGLETVTFYAPPGEVGANIRDVLKRELEGHTEHQVDVVVPEDYDQSITALCEGVADGAWLSTPAYVLCHEQCGAGATFKVERRGRTDQVAQILVQADARRQAREVQPIRSLDDLEDKSVAFVDPLSTTGYLIPKTLFLKKDIALGEELFVGGDDRAILALYRGEVDVAATYWQPIRRDGSVGDARAELLNLYPDIVEATKVLRLSEPIPNAPIVFRPGLSPSLRRELVAAFVALSTSEETMVAFREASGVTGFVPTSDASYDVVREIGERLELDFAQIITGIPY